MGVMIVEGKGQFGGKGGASHCNQRGRRRTLPNLLLEDLIHIKRPTIYQHRSSLHERSLNKQASCREAAWEGVDGMTDWREGKRASGKLESAGAGLLMGHRCAAVIGRSCSGRRWVEIDGKAI